MKRIQINLLIWLCWLLIGTAGFANAEESTPRAPQAESVIQLSDILDAARSQNPAILSAKAEWLAAKKRVWQETSLPDPMGGFDVMGGMTETRVGPQKIAS